MIWPSTLVASGRTRATSGEATTESSSVSSTGHECSPGSAYRSDPTERIWATPLSGNIISYRAACMGRSSYQTYSKMARLATSVATATGAGSTYAQRRAVSLDVAKTLAVVALLRCCRLSVVPVPDSPEPRAVVYLGEHVLSVVRGSGHPFDSCPEPPSGHYSGQIAGNQFGTVGSYVPGCLPFRCGSAK